MKTFYSTLFICAALWRGVCYAEPPAPSPAPSVSGNSANTPANPPSGSVHLLPQAGSTKVIVTAKTAPLENKTTGLNNSTARPSGAIRTTGPLFKDARNRAPATGVLGGPAKSKTTPVISGTSINHKPL